MTRLARLFALAAAIALIPPTVAQEKKADDKKADDKKAEKVDNPEYKTWAKYKAGTAVTVKMMAEGGGQKFESTTTNTLVEVKDDKVVVETVTTTTFMGKENKTPAQKRDVPKQTDKGPMGFDPKTGKPDGTTDEGKEKVKIGGTEFECKWYKVKNKVKAPTGGEEEVEAKIWMSEEVPGLMVKLESKTKMGGMTMEATDVTIKK